MFLFIVYLWTQALNDTFREARSNISQRPSKGKFGISTANCGSVTLTPTLCGEGSPVGPRCLGVVSTNRKVPSELIAGTVDRYSPDL